MREISSEPDQSGEPFQVQQAKQTRACRAAWKEAGHARAPRPGLRSIFALVTDEGRATFGGRAGAGESSDQAGTIDKMRAIFGRTHAAAPDRRIDERRGDETIAEADTLLLTVPNQLGVAYCTHAIEAALTQVAPALGWR